MSGLTAPFRRSSAPNNLFYVSSIFLYRMSPEEKAEGTLVAAAHLRLFSRVKM